jgi:BRCA1-associated protein
MQMKDAILASKLDAISWEYNHLLTSQLDSQRQYFEAKLAEAEAAAERRAAAAAAEALKAAEVEKAAAADAREAERRRQQLEKKLVGGEGRVGWQGSGGRGRVGRSG